MTQTTWNHGESPDSGCLDACVPSAFYEHHFLQSATTAKEQRSNEKNDEYDEQDLGYGGSNSGNAKKAKEPGDQCDNQKDDGVVKHGVDLALHGLDLNAK